MRILITGGGGFIGSHLADRLLAEGEVEVRPGPEGDAPSILLHLPRTERDCSWAKGPLDEGIARAVEWNREHGVGETYIHLKPEELKAAS